MGTADIEISVIILVFISKFRSQSSSFWRCSCSAMPSASTTIRCDTGMTYMRTRYTKSYKTSGLLLGTTRRRATPYQVFYITPLLLSSCDPLLVSRRHVQYYRHLLLLLLCSNFMEMKCIHCRYKGKSGAPGNEEPWRHAIPTHWFRGDDSFYSASENISHNHLTLSKPPSGSGINTTSYCRCR